MFVDEELQNQYVTLVDKFHIGDRVLDLGCGTAPVAIKLAKKGYFVTATDLSTDMLEVAYNNAIQEDVKVNFFIHDILDTVNQDYDVITMTSDVINYLENIEQVDQAIHNVSLAMNTDSVFIFDFLRPTYLRKIGGHYEEILAGADVIKWTVERTNIDNQIKHIVDFGYDKEVHVQTTYPFKEFQEILHKYGVHVVKKVKLEERIILVCKKEI